MAALLDAGRIRAPAGLQLEILGEDPVLPSRFAAGEAAALAIGLAAGGAERLHAERTGVEQAVRVDVRAAAASLVSFLLQRLPEAPSIARDAGAVTALYRAGDGRWIHLHGGFPHLARGTCELLGCESEKSAIEAALLDWSAFDLEDALAARGLCGAAVRSPEEWAEHPQGRAIADLPVLEIERIGDAPPEPLAPGSRPLEGVRALDLTRVLAGPSCARTLAEHGASVLRIGAERLPSIEPFVIDTGRGKRNAYLDLDEPRDAERLQALCRGADVFSQGYRLGSLERRGFGPHALAELRPGIVYVSIDCYGHQGPWAGRPGWEQLAQSATGIAHVEGGVQTPRLIPAAATDYTTGALAAFGVMQALLRRSVEGGSWWVRASLAQTAAWLLRIGASCDPAAARGIGDSATGLVTVETAWGELAHLPPVAEMSETPPHWALPPAPLGVHPARWSERAAT